MGTLVSTTLSQAEKDYAVAFTQVQAIKRSIAAETARGNQAGVEAMAPLYRDWLAKLNTAAAILGRPEVALTATDRTVLSIGGYIEQAANALPNAVAKIPFAVGAGLVKGALPFIALAGAYLYFRGKL